MKTKPNKNQHTIGSHFRLSSSYKWWRSSERLMRSGRKSRGSRKSGHVRSKRSSLGRTMRGPRSPSLSKARYPHAWGLLCCRSTLFHMISICFCFVFYFYFFIFYLFIIFFFLSHYYYHILYLFFRILFFTGYVSAMHECD